MTKEHGSIDLNIQPRRPARAETPGLQALKDPFGGTFPGKP